MKAIEFRRNYALAAAAIFVLGAPQLALASTQGRLRLALRNPLNSERVLTKGANVGALLSSFRPKQAPKAAQNGQGEIRIEVIKGDVRKEVKF